MSTKIRMASVQDARGIATAHVLMWQKAYRGLIPDEYLGSLSIDERTKKWQKNLSDAKFELKIFVAESDGMVAGFVCGGKSRDEDQSKNVGELGAIYVHPDWQGKGIGSLLMDAFLKWLKSEGYEKATLWVLDTNKATRQWYESKGWVPDGKLKTDNRGSFDLNEVRHITDL